MHILTILDKKRCGQAHSQEEIHFLVQGMMDGSIADYQVSAWLMAVCINGLNLDETTWLTEAFIHSGTVLDLSSIDGVVVDKHSTGGVGDKATLVLVPLLAASGLKVAKLSGRGLGFTGGTADKLEAIPGFKVAMNTADFVAQIRQIGAALSSQTVDLAPADAKMYALRDVTSTVASIPLIAASVVSKKIAAGAQVIVLDIKAGRGAFMKTVEEARALAQTCQAVGKRLGKTLMTVISSMDQPLGYAIGHTVEVEEAIHTLQGKGPQDLEELCLILGGMSLVGAGKAPSLEAAKDTLAKLIHSGAALAKFKDLITVQGGDASILEHPEKMPQPKEKRTLLASQSGYVAEIDSLRVAESAKLLGAGRLKKEDAIDLSVGVILHKKVGDSVTQGEALAELWIGEKPYKEAMAVLEQAFIYTTQPVTPPPLVDEFL